MFATCSLLAADLKDTVSAAAKKLTEDGNYSWKQTMDMGGGGFGGGGPMVSQGKTLKDGLTWTSMEIMDNTIERLAKGTNSLSDRVRQLNVRSFDLQRSSHLRNSFLNDTASIPFRNNARSSSLLDTLGDEESSSRRRLGIESGASTLSYASGSCSTTNEFLKGLWIPRSGKLLIKNCAALFLCER